MKVVAVALCGPVSVHGVMPANAPTERGRLQRRQDSQPAGPNLEFYRAISDELTIDFHRNVFLAADAQAAAFENTRSPAP